MWMVRLDRCRRWTAAWPSPSRRLAVASPCCRALSMTPRCRAPLPSSPSPSLPSPSARPRTAIHPSAPPPSNPSPTAARSIPSAPASASSSRGSDSDSSRGGSSRSEGEPDPSLYATWMRLPQRTRYYFLSAMFLFALAGNWATNKLEERYPVKKYSDMVAEERRAALEAFEREQAAHAAGTAPPTTLPAPVASAEMRTALRKWILQDEAAKLAELDALDDATPSNASPRSQSGSPSAT
ncbi:hypothetical protein CXG81DRAFT_26035 [Caulochytrium protostelioides]|uniref:Transmembrane protein n=1 Tax=Caulochytrium protostelioides TaxID=1555241 RepID=A0A4P9X7P8_9FUNG|nr:hypothetical protein CXG81DRAFT_26035 [Caulochytrium protostelioides]|eukprot:RKP01274.1 hypothetical protein CXG81DRAFT_26035 [Caulochytrium protostelioides]